jgi:hypothetical protein
MSDKKNKRFLYLISVLNILIFSSFVFYNYQNSKGAVNSETDSVDINDLWRQTWENSIVFSSGLESAGSSFFETGEGIRKPLKDVAVERGVSNALVIRVTNSFCIDCLTKELSTLNKIGQRVGNENILFACTPDIYTDITRFLKSNGLNFPTYKADKIGTIREDQIYKPYVFVWDNKYQKATAFYIMNPDALDINKIYFNLITNLHFTQTNLPFNASIKFKDTVIDLGTIEPNKVVEKKVNFQNDGKNPLQIVSIDSDCGCTTAFYSRKIINPLDTGSISVRYSSDKVGGVDKLVYVYANTKKSPLILHVKGEVK